MGFQVVEADWNDLGARLNAGTVHAAYLNPAAVAAFQLHLMMKNMLSTNIAPIMGGMLINQHTWRRIGALDPRYQQELLRVTRQMTAEFDSTMQRTVDDAVRTMSRAGLKVNEPSPTQEQLWYAEMEKAAPSIVGSVLDRDLYNRINAILARHRSGR
jgi:TRAP-type C4-dicarboxylate transport system substrate-binding protein